MRRQLKNVDDFDLDNVNGSGPSVVQWIIFSAVSLVAVSSVLLNVILVVIVYRVGFELACI